jgi:hypothetical protein
MIKLSSFLETTETSVNPCNSLKSSIFQAFIALRPTLTSTEGKVSNKSLKELYSLAFILLGGSGPNGTRPQDSSNMSLQLTYRQRRDITINLTGKYVRT